MADDARYLIEIRDSLLGGLGVFAKTDTPKGTRVLAESFLPGYALSPAEQKEYLSLHKHTGDLARARYARYLRLPWDRITKLHRAVLSVYEANALTNIDGVVLLGSRFNHSCVLNVHFAHNEALDKMTFHAVRDIEKGEELAIDYVKAANLTRSHRQEKLSKYEFICTCPACVVSVLADESERKREQMRILDQEFLPAVIFPTNKNCAVAVTAAQELAQLMISEGLFSGRLGNA
ncbi:hypothetical protein BDV19DRAFT_394174 [Aspergillus venezuelensis]